MDVELDLCWTARYKPPPGDSALAASYASLTRGTADLHLLDWPTPELLREVTGVKPDRAGPTRC